MNWDISSASTRHLLAYFDEWTLSKGRDYFKRGYVDRMWSEKNGDIHGLVKGSNQQVYRTKLYLDEFRLELESTECSCPIGEDCKHTVALYISYLEYFSEQEIIDSREAKLRLLRKLVSLSGSPIDIKRLNDLTVKMEAPPTVASLPFEVRRKFEQIADAIGTGTTREIEAKPPTKKGARQSIVVYILKKTRWRTDINVEINSVSVLKDGSYGKLNTLWLDRLLSNPPAYATEEDFKIVRFWDGIAQRGSGYWTSAPHLSDAEPELVYILMKKILDTGRCYYEDVNSRPIRLGQALPGVLKWEEVEANNFGLVLEAKDGDKFHPCLSSVTHRWYVDREASVCGPVEIPFNSEILKHISNMRPLTLDELDRLPLLLSDLGLLGVLPPPPSTGKFEVRLIKPIPTLDVKKLRTNVDLVTEEREVLARAGDKVKVAVVSMTVPPHDKEPRVDESGKTIIEKVDTTAVKSLTQPLERLGFSETESRVFSDGPGKRYLVSLDPGAWIDFDDKKIAQMRTEGWQISEETKDALLPLEPDSDDIELEISGESNWWFSLALNISFNGKSVPLLPLLISAIRRLRSSDSLGDSLDSLNKNGKFIGQLHDGTLISLPFDRIKSILQSLKELIEKGLDPDNKMPVVDAADLFEDETLSRSKFIGADKIIRLVDSLKSLSQIQPVDDPENFGTKLREYQREGVAWLQFMAQQEFGGILADDMGLGKTIQLLAHICLEKQNNRLTAPYLVICPTSVLPNWLAETRRFSPQLNVVAYHGLGRLGVLKELEDADIVVSTYPIISRDSGILSKIEWHGIALDEAQAIKNHTTKMAQAARSLKAKHKFCLTGTPVENHLGELWSQFQFLLPGLLSDAATFKRVFRDPIEKLGDVQQKRVLSRRVKPFIIRRTKQEVAQELPDKTIIMQKVQLEGPQRDLYETVRLATSKKVRDEIAQKGFKHSQIMILDALLKMRQVCCDPRLVKLSAASKVNASAKLDRLIEMLSELAEEGRKILVFSQFTSMLELIENRLIEENLEFVKLTGSTKDRAHPVNEFQNGNVPIFLISLKAGGTGLNLTAADVVIHYDPWWNPSVEEQATDRAHRIGQTKKVFVYKFIAEGTIEERMQALQERKRSIAASIYDEQGNLSMKFSEDDLESLLRPIEED